MDINMSKNSNNPPSKSMIKIGMLVLIVKKQDQRSGALTEGMVKRILTKSAHHPHGIKVMIDTGEVGRVQEIITEED